MANPDAKQVLAAARESLARPFDYDEFLGKLAPKDKASAGRRVDVFEAELGGERAQLWKRLACTLMKLSAHAAKLVGKQTVQFYVAEGRYRMQVFALEDLGDGNFAVYCPDVLHFALATGLLAPSDPADSAAHAVVATGEPIRVETLSGSSHNPAPHFKDMTGWNRKALRVTLPLSPTPSQVEAAELLCAVAAQHFPPVAAT